MADCSFQREKQKSKHHLLSTSLLLCLPIKSNTTFQKKKMSASKWVLLFSKRVFVFQKKKRFWPTSVFLLWVLENLLTLYFFHFDSNNGKKENPCEKPIFFTQGSRRPTESTIATTVPTTDVLETTAAPPSPPHTHHHRYIISHHHIQTTLRTTHPADLINPLPPSHLILQFPQLPPLLPPQPHRSSLRFPKLVDLLRLVNREHPWEIITFCCELLGLFLFLNFCGIFVIPTRWILWLLSLIA